MEKKEILSEKEVYKNQMSKALSTIKSVTERDLQLMRWIGTNGLASFKQIWMVFWPVATERTCRERLALLEKNGLIEQHYVQTSRMRDEQIFTLTNLAATHYFDAALRKRLMVGLPSRAELKQQLMAQDARIVLEGLAASVGKRIVRWQNERELRRETAFFKREESNSTRRIGLNMADIADARIFIGEAGTTVSSSYAFNTAESGERPATTILPAFNTRLTRLAISSKNGPGNFLSHPEVHAGPDLLASLTNFLTLNLEIDGDYFGQMLKTKIHEINRGNHPTIWITTPKRAERIEEEINGVGASKIWLLSIDPFI